MTPGKRSRIPKISQPEPAKPTPEESAMEEVTGVAKVFLGKMSSATSAITSFKASLEQSLCYAFEWASGAMSAAAQLHVFTQAWKAITDEDGKPTPTRTGTDGKTWDTLPRLKDYAQAEVNRRAQSPSRSSSPTANIMEQEYLAAWAKVLEAIEWA